MTATTIRRESLPDPTGPVEIHTNDGQLIGTLTFEKGTSRLTYATDQQPHRRWPLKRKHRQR